MLSGGLIGLEDPDGTTITDPINLQTMMVMYYTMETNIIGGRTPAVGYISMNPG